MQFLFYFLEKNKTRLERLQCGLGKCELIFIYLLFIYVFYILYMLQLCGDTDHPIPANW